MGNGESCSKILLVDDDREFADLLAFVVTQAGLVPLIACEPSSALEIFDKEQPTLAIIDLDLRPGDGFELLAELRRRSLALHIVVLTAQDSEDDKVRALEMGADDYLLKSCGHRELIARVRAHARRADNDRDRVAAPAVLEVGPLRLDPAERMLRIDGAVLRLSATEFRMLYFLMQNSDAVVPTAALAMHVWGYDDAPAREVVRVTVHRLRRKLGDKGPQHRFIHTVPGVGLKFRPVDNGHDNEPTVL